MKHSDVTLVKWGGYICSPVALFVTIQLITFNIEDFVGCNLPTIRSKSRRVEKRVRSPRMDF